jgi:hypothetical protein
MLLGGQGQIYHKYYKKRQIRLTTAEEHIALPPKKA